MSDIKHQRLQTNGIWMHIAEKGQGPLVLLIHGFPELWSSWTYQINQLAEQGYHVVAPDMRGYGDSDCPLDPASYTAFHLVGDLIGLLDQLGEEKVLSLTLPKCPWHFDAHIEFNTENCTNFGGFFFFFFPKV